MKTAILILLALGLSDSVSAQTPGRGPMVLDLPASTRALGLGTAYVLSGNESELLFANPALLADASGFQLSGGTWGLESFTARASGAGEWLGGGVGFGLRVLDYGATSNRSNLVAGDEFQLLEEGDYGAGQMAATLGYGREVGPVTVGVSGHLLRDRLDGTGSTTAAFDVGVAAEVSRFTVGVVAQSLGPDMDLAGESIPLPERYTLGVSSERAWVGPLDIAGTAAVTYRVDGTWIPAGGVEVAWWPVTGRTLVGRVGIRDVPAESQAQAWTVGGAFEGDRISLEYAFQGYDEYDGAHHFGIRLR
jgi:hypothetical protein